MDKRTLIAFVLSFAILLLWSFYFTPKPDQKAPSPAKEPALTEQPAPSAGPTTAPSPQGPAGTVSPAPAGGDKGIPSARVEVQEKEIHVETPLYKAVFTNVGPTIRSFKLKNYREAVEPQSPLIEMVTFGRASGDFVNISFTGAPAVQGGAMTYRSDRDRVVVNPEASRESLSFTKSLDGGISMTQTFHFYPDQYAIDVDVFLLNGTGGTLNGSFTVNLKARPPEKKRGYYSYIGLAALLGGKLKEIKLEKDTTEEALSGPIGWAGYEDDFFITALIPQEAASAQFTGRLLPSGILEGSYVAPAVEVQSSAKTSARYTLYVGPRDLGQLKKVGMGLDRAVDFGWTNIIAKPLLHLLRFFNGYIHNYGLSIILLTMLIKILFWPLTHKSYKSMKEMQKLQPRMAKIREKYKNNKEQMNKEMMGLYKTYKVNPMGGCLPMIIQIPVFFALFRILGSAIELRHAPFALWINDLSAPDRLFRFPFEVPFMAPPYGIPILTLLMGASMFIQQKMTPTPGDPTQAKVMMFLPIIFTVMFINFPSGLVLYWLVNNILSIGQQYRIQRR